jgi:phosphoglycerate dehydrogenase-like enzyme
MILVPAGALLDQLGDVDDELVMLGAGVSPSEAITAADAIVFGGELRHLVGSLDNFSRLRFIQTLNAGVEWLLPHVPDGVIVCNASGVHDGPVAEWVVAMMLAHVKQFGRYWDAFRAGQWDTQGNALTARSIDEIDGDDLDGKSVVIIGHGSIGRAIERRLSPFGATVIGVAATARPGVLATDGGHDDAIAQAVGSADTVVIMTPLTDRTRGLVDARFLSSMKDGAMLINGARGPIVDHGALESELRSGRLFAALDVTDPEPLPPNSSLWSAPNLIVTPHIAGSAKRWQPRAYRFAGDQLRAWLADPSGATLTNIRTGY